MPFVKHIVIAAAGLGSRLGHGKPKCLIDIMGKPLIAHLLNLLSDIEDIRIVVGFQENLVIQTVLQLRKDALFVRNPNFQSTKTVESYALGAAGLKGHVLYMDADIIFEPTSFRNFINLCHNDKFLVGITNSKTIDAVYVRLDDKFQIKSFSRQNKSNYEWANILYAPADYFMNDYGDVFFKLEKNLPLAAHYIDCYEIDCLEDLQQVQSIFDPKGMIKTNDDIIPNLSFI